VTRQMATQLSKILGKPVIVINQPGAGGKVGLQAMLKAPHDGHTIGTVVPATMVSLPLTDKSYGIDPLKEFTPLTIAVDTFMLLMANAEAGKTLKDFTANARANPGKFNYGTLGAGICRKEKCEVSRAPSMDCAQLHSCNFLVTKRWVAGKDPNSSCGTSGRGLVHGSGPI